MAFLLTLPVSAGAFVYWANDGGGSGTTIGRAGLDGAGESQSFISGADGPNALAVGGQYVYWANTSTQTIGRAKLDGSDANQSFIDTGTDDTGLAVDASHIYWSDLLGKKIGRADLNGSFISTASYPEGIALNDSYIYWANAATPSVGRAKLSGSEVEQSFIATANPVAGLALDADHLYWATAAHNTIARANLNGSGVEEGFITGAARPIGVAVDSQNLYWTNLNTGTIGRANLDGSEPSETFIEGANQPTGIALDSLPHASATSVSCAPASIGLPGSATCTATVTDAGPFTAAPGPSAPDGTVSFSSNAAGSFSPTSSCALFSSGPGVSACQLTYAPTALGNQAISASYPGDALHTASNGATALEVGASIPATSLPSEGKSRTPSNRFTLGKPRLNAKKGTATITAKVPGPGKLVIAGKGAKRLAKHANGAGKVALGVKPTKSAMAKLSRSGKDSLKLTITYTPNGGKPASRREKVTLRLNSR